MSKVRRWPIPIFIAVLILGLMLSAQFRTQQIYLSSLTVQKSDDLVQILKKLHDKRSELELEQSSLTDQQYELNSHASQGTALADNIDNETRQQQLELGLVPVTGKGITITIDSSSPIVYLDLVDLVNELWGSQAEAISINGQRLTIWSGIYWDRDSTSLTVNGQEITFPIVIKAVGNPVSMEASLKLLGGVLDNLAVYKVYPKLAKSNHLQLPAGTEPKLSYIAAK